MAAPDKVLRDVMTINRNVAKGASVAIDLHDVGREVHRCPGEQLARVARRLGPPALRARGRLGCVNEEDAHPRAVLEQEGVAVDHPPYVRSGSRRARLHPLRVVGGQTRGKASGDGKHAHDRNEEPTTKRHRTPRSEGTRAWPGGSARFQQRTPPMEVTAQVWAVPAETWLTVPRSAGAPAT